MNSKLWEERRESNDVKRVGDVRSEWARDYGRLIHSAAFRRLQSKTQVLGLGESDFYRTRLTHSMEVSQIGVGIIRHLKNTCLPGELKSNLLPSTALMSTICLAHDLGHPPFGHGGEVALNICMRDYGGFEGNAQTLRILSKLDKSSKSHGLNPTRRLLLGILKYPIPYSRAVNNKFYESLGSPKWLSKSNKNKPPKCYFDSEKSVVEWILRGFNQKDREEFTRIKAGIDNTNKHHKSIHKSFDCSVMELADDISYCIHDLEDAVSLKLIVKDDWIEIFGSEEKLFDSLGMNYDEITKDLFSSEGYKRKRVVGDFVNKMIINTEVIKPGNIFEHELLACQAVLLNNAKCFLEKLGELVVNKVIRNTNVQLLEFKGQRIIVELFEALSSDSERLLPSSTKVLYRAASDENAKQRVLCDYIAGMTDIYATKLYEKIFLPNMGSIFDSL